MRDLVSKRAPGFELVWFLVGYILVCVFLVFLVQSSQFESNPSFLSWAVLADLAITAPLAYAIFIRNTWLPKFSIVTLSIAGVVLASFIVPSDHRDPIVAIRNWMIPILELGVVAFVLVSANRVLREWKSIESFDRQEAIAKIARRLFGANRIATLLAAEITMLYYLFRWPVSKQHQLRRIEAPRGAEVFTYDRDGGMRALLLAFLMVVAIELVAVHVLIEMWSTWLAWIASLSTVYMAMMIIAQVRAIPCRPIFVHDGQLRITNGMFKIADVPLELISHVEPVTAANESEVDAPDLMPLSCSLPASPNVAVYLSEEFDGELLYGKTQPFKLACLHVDDPDRFIAALQRYCNQ